MKELDLPIYAKGGVPIEQVNVQPEVRKYSETADWEYREEARFWYGISQEMDPRFFNGLVYPDGSKVPAPLIAFDDLRNKTTLAVYDLFPDEYGFLGKITFNNQHYLDAKTDDGKLIKVWKWGKYAQGETLLHEYIHVWQQIGRGKKPYKGGRETHNAEFVEFAESLGIHPAKGRGHHTQIATPGSPIDILLREKGITPPPDAFKKPEETTDAWFKWLIKYWGREERKGRSTLSKWVCESCGLNVRIGISGDPELLHIPCGSVLVRDDGKANNVYDAR